MIRFAIAALAGSVVIAAFVMSASTDPRASALGLSYFAFAGAGTGFLARRRGALAAFAAQHVALLWSVLFPAACPAMEGAYCGPRLDGYLLLAGSFFPVTVLVTIMGAVGQWIRTRIVRR